MKKIKTVLMFPNNHYTDKNKKKKKEPVEHMLDTDIVQDEEEE
jgi:hypothetical protein